ncbi:MAG: tRNA 2-thiocytidine(32) synthetase TtcA [Desulfomonile tiedjei]|uniref:tRNA 2-thiocytidine(32) synthetase TtcA n=1 Tax=Desulfomonile tiedjei TaxID=2358 RepID=A0A9D6V228_9BACT|nr:tRNA 2-thiocytidine(32) synthetase TtcA [Desulfomonile tiedjei]
MLLRDRIFKTLTRLVGRAIGDFNLIEDQDRILVALSGGKDSWSLLYALRHLQRKAPIKYEIAAITIHPGRDTFDLSALHERLILDGIKHEIVDGHIVDIVNENLTDGTNPCSFCSRLRRGMLYTFAAREGWNKIALGHHLDDFVETLMLNMFFNGSIKGMSPKLLADDCQNIVIRPLVYVREEITRTVAAGLKLPILGCSCAYQGMSGSRRQWVKQLLKSVEQEIPDVKSNLLASMGRVRDRHLFRKRSLGEETDTIRFVNDD